MQQDQHKIRHFFSIKRVLIPIILGLSISGYLLISTFDPAVFAGIHWTAHTFFWIFMAMLMMFTRDLSYMFRIRHLTDKHLSWKRSFQVIMLWEFASAVTPSVVGGSAIAFLIVNKEGIKLGRATAIVMVTAMLDELFYILTVPVVLLIVGNASLFAGQDFHLFGLTLDSLGIFLAGYFFLVFLTLFISTAIFITPKGFRKFLYLIFGLRLLKRWRRKALKMGSDIVVTSKEMKHKPIGYWLKAFGATFASWTARYMVVNCLILAFMPVDNHFLLYARQLVMWVVMLISPTPGSSGIAEMLFTDYLGVFIIAGFAPTLALIWRLISYYAYLIIGSIVLPIWARRVFSKK